MKIIFQSKKTGFISIFAIFFSAVVLSILTALYILLVKQIELMNLDASSFQAIYMADSAFECAIYKEQNASSTDSIFVNGTNLTFCATTGDATWQSNPTTNSNRSKSILNISMDSPSGDKFCGVVTADKQTGDTSLLTSAPPPNTLVISGQNRDCSVPATTKVIEREIDFYY